MEIRLKAIEPVEGFSIGEVIIVFIARIILHLQLPRVDRSLSLLSPLSLSLDRSINTEPFYRHQFGFNALQSRKFRGKFQAHPPSF